MVQYQTEMADQAREEKIAAARKRLRKFQQRKQPHSTPNSPATQPENKKDHVELANGIVTKSSPNGQILENSPYSSTSVNKIKQMLNGFAKQDSINDEDPIIAEIDALEQKNFDLEKSLSSHKRNNEHLGNHVNEQRKQIIQLQEQIKKERTELANRQLLEQRSLKEQLQVHIQTIGILVSEKSDLQTTLSQLQRRFQTKEGECVELTSRVKNLRQQTAEHERIVATQKSKIDKYSEENNELRKSRDRVQTSNYTLSREKEDLVQQNSEIRQKLQVKVNECLSLGKTNSETAKKLDQAELLVQQLSDDPSASAAHDLTKALRDEKAELEDRVAKQTLSLQKLASDKGETIERHNNEIEQFEFKLQKFVELNEQLENEKLQWTEVQQEYEETISELRKNLDELNDEEATHQSEATRLAAQEIQKLAEEKEMVARFLQEQSDENDKLNNGLAESKRKVLQLEQLVNNLSKESEDKRELLESIQSDKETISRALQQNKDLKEQLEELETRFIQMSNENMELTTSLESERHANRDIGEKLSETSVELTETKELVSKHEVYIEQLNKSLNEQIDANVKNQHFEAQGHLTDVLHQELQSAQETINQLSSQNSELKQLVLMEQNKHRNESPGSTPEIIVDDESKDWETAQQMPDLLKTGDLRVEPEQAFGNMDGNISDEDSWPSESSEGFGEEPSITPSSHPAPSKYTNREDVVNSMSASIRQLEMERDELRHQLAEVAGRSQTDINLLQEHMEMQVHQQVQQRQRDLLEQVHEQLREQQQQILALQELVQKQKRQIENQDAEVDEIDLENSTLPYEQLKPAFSKLQMRFLRIMSEKADLLDKIQELEHVCQQLSAETETIGEYISLYQMQRTALKQYYYEREKLITHLSNERAQMQAKVGQLQSLVVRQLQGRQKLRQIHEQSPKETLISKNADSSLSTLSDDLLSQQDVLRHKVDTIEDQTTEDQDTTSEASVVSIGLEQVDMEDLETLAAQDGTTQQILQIFGQLNDSGEGAKTGWFSLAARKHRFSPCPRCQDNMLDV